MSHSLSGQLSLMAFTAIDTHKLLQKFPKKFGDIMESSIRTKNYLVIKKLNKNKNENVFAQQ